MLQFSARGTLKEANYQTHDAKIEKSLQDTKRDKMERVTDEKAQWSGTTTTCAASLLVTALTIFFCPKPRLRWQSA